MVQRRRNDDDRRAYVVSITASGRRMLARADTRIDEFLSHLFTTLTAAHRRELATALTHMVDAGNLPGFEIDETASR